ncbi:unnamed protein product [Ectocarpus sp. CCAP 1310/34]|nr:unnamed protein product [Ectocarpus sp. CCAP 1310/34]
MSATRNSDGTSGRKRPLEPPRGDQEAPQSLSRRTPTRQFKSPPSAGDLGRDDGNSKSNDGQDQYGEESDIFDAADLPNDTMATVLSLQREFYGGQPRTGGGERTGVVLQHQIYTVLENRTAVDVELTGMRKENVLRTFRLGTGGEDWGVMSTAHYLRVISNCLGDTITRENGSKQPARTTAASVRGGHAIARSSTGTVGGSRNTANASTSRGSGGSGGGSSSGRRSPTSTSFSVCGASPKPSAQEHHSSLARNVLVRLVLSNTKAYASRKEVLNTMREVRESNTEASGGGASAAAPGGAAVSGGVGGRGKGKEGAPDRKISGDEEKDLRSLKQTEEEVVSLTSKLIRAGFLLPRRDVGREEAYWFSMPQLGKVITSIARGRKDVLAALKRTRYKEMRRAALEKKNPAKATGLPLSFHVRDLLGLGLIRELDTPSGMFLRLPSDSS